MRWANENGIARVHSAGGDAPEIALYEDLQRRGELTVRFYVGYSIAPPGPKPGIIDTIEAMRRRLTGNWLNGGAVKLMADGVIESHTAQMLAPYSDDTTTSGSGFWERGALQSTVTELDRRGFQCGQPLGRVAA